MIKGVSKVYLAVDDQDRAKQFWTETMAFDLAKDEAYGDERWIEVSPPDKSVVLALTRRAADEPRREPRDNQLPHSNVFFTCDDIEATYEELTERGVKFPVPPQEMHFGWWSLFEDVDGSRYALSTEA
ncbi:MAG: VOC family protein [Acidimicrobiales bacterium]